jgi:hypothetical protein
VVSLSAVAGTLCRATEVTTTTTTTTTTAVSVMMPQKKQAQTNSSFIVPSTISAKLGSRKSSCWRIRNTSSTAHHRRRDSRNPLFSLTTWNYTLVPALRVWSIVQGLCVVEWAQSSWCCRSRGMSPLFSYVYVELKTVESTGRQLFCTSNKRDEHAPRL